MAPFLNVIPGGRLQKPVLPPKYGGSNSKNGGKNYKMAPHLRKKTCYSEVRGIKMAPFLNVLPGGRLQEPVPPPRCGRGGEPSLLPPVQQVH
jgi:hypothetical protein